MALELIDQTHFDAVVTDMRMPGMDGGELLNRLAEKHPGYGADRAFRSL